MTEYTKSGIIKGLAKAYECLHDGLVIMDELGGQIRIEDGIFVRRDSEDSEWKVLGSLFGKKHWKAVKHRENINVDFTEFFSAIRKEIFNHLKDGTSAASLLNDSGLTAPVLAKFRHNKMTTPNYKTMKGLSLGLGHKGSYLMELLLFLDGCEGCEDPRILVRAE